MTRRGEVPMRVDISNNHKLPNGQHSHHQTDLWINIMEAPKYRLELNLIGPKEILDLLEPEDVLKCFETIKVNKYPKESDRY